jgi:hypothetical protein
MSQSRYREARTLVRRLCRLRHEDRAGFKTKLARLREHFERFNLDTADLCQWLMGLRKQYVKSFANPSDADAASFGALGDFLLEPAIDGSESDEKTRDRWRLHVFDDVAGLRSVTNLDDQPLPAPLREAMNAAAAARPHQGSKNSNACKLFERLRTLEPQHRLVLVKSAAEWVVARYLRGVENWKNGHKAWEDEKADWEKAHPELTSEIRDRFTNVFKQLADPKRDDKPGLRKKNPRICPYERLRQNSDNCAYAGEKGHGPLCWKYVEFVRAQKASPNSRFNKKRFWEDAQKLVGFCAEKKVKPSNAFLSPNMPGILFKDAPLQKRTGLMNQLKTNWNAYLKHMALNAETVVQHGRLPHCQTIGEKFEKSKCVCNPHTDYCLKYKLTLTNPDNGFDDATLALEPLYRQWRKLYLARPRKPQFRYPSSRDLPMPKVFGEGFFDIDFDNSILRLRLDDMSSDESQWFELGFTPWPRDYSPSREQIKDLVTSVHLNFVSPSRCRIGFRFDVEHQPSRFGVTQDELDDLRSKSFPRQADDQKFIDAARERLRKSFSGDFDRDLRLIAVDMGMGGAHAAVYEGKSHKKDIAIPIHKFDKLYTDLPDAFKGKKDQDGNITPDTRGLRKEHVGRHLKSISEGAAAIAEKRQQDTDNPMQTLRDADFRGLKRHIRWMVRDWARLNAKQIVKAAEEHHCDLIVFESLRGSRRPDYEKLGDEAERQKAERIIYAYGQVRRKVTEKAVERGMRTVTAPYHKSSKFCSRCGREQENDGLWLKNKKKDKKFICEHKDCGTEVDSDANAARLLARVFWGEITLPALSPGG